MGSGWGDLQCPAEAVPTELHGEPRPWGGQHFEAQEQADEIKSKHFTTTKIETPIEFFGEAGIRKYDQHIRTSEHQDRYWK